MPKTRLTRHCLSRIGVRASISQEELQRLLDENRCVNIWFERNTFKVHRMCYSAVSDDYFVAVQDVFTGTVATLLLPEHETHRTRISPEMRRSCKELALDQALPLFTGTPWGFVSGEITDSASYFEFVGRYRNKKNRDAPPRLKPLFRADPNKHGRSVLQALSNRGVRHNVWFHMRQNRRGHEFFDGFGVRFEDEGFVHPLGGHDLFDHVPVQEVEHLQRREAHARGQTVSTLLALLLRDGRKTVIELMPLESFRPVVDVKKIASDEKLKDGILDKLEASMLLDDELLGFGLRPTQISWLRPVAWDEIFLLEPPESCLDQSTLNGTDWHSVYAESQLQHGIRVLADDIILTLYAIAQDDRHDVQKIRLCQVDLRHHGHDPDVFLQRDFEKALLTGFRDLSADRWRDGRKTHTIECVRKSEPMRVYARINLRQHFLDHGLIEGTHSALFTKDQMVSLLRRYLLSDGQEGANAELVSLSPPFDKFYCSVVVVVEGREEEIAMGVFDAAPHVFSWRRLLADAGVRRTLSAAWQSASRSWIATRQVYQFDCLLVKQGDKAVPLRIQSRRELPIEFN